MADDTNSPVPARPLGLYPTAGESVDAPCADTNLERAVDSIGVGRLLICIADALAKDMQNPAVLLVPTELSWPEWKTRRSIRSPSVKVSPANVSDRFSLAPAESSSLDQSCSTVSAA